MISPAFIFNRVTGNRWFAVGLLLVMTVLLVLVATTFEESSLPLPRLHSRPDPVDRLIPVKKIQQLSSNLILAPVQPLANGSHPFFTAHFKPPPPPPAAPVEVKEIPPPAPAVPVVKKVALLFQGVYQTADGHDKAFVQSDGKLSVLPVGGAVLENWSVAEINRQKLTLTNRAAETTILEFNREKILEIPVP